MNLSRDTIEELNELLRDSKLDIPDFRREISPNGNNYRWLQKHILRQNPNAPDKLIELLGMKR